MARLIKASSLLLHPTLLMNVCINGSEGVSRHTSINDGEMVGLTSTYHREWLIKGDTPLQIDEYGEIHNVPAILVRNGVPLEERVITLSIYVSKPLSIDDLPVELFL